MAKPCKKIWRTLIGLGFAACGISKVLGMDIQEKRFSQLNWTQGNMKTIGGTQIAGAALLLGCKKTSKLGALILAASALCLLVTGLKHNKKEELAIDGIGLFAALSILFGKKCK